MKGISCLTSLTGFYNEMASLVDEVDVVYLDISKAFDTISHNTLMDKLAAYRLGKWTVRETENRQNGQAQRAVISSTKSSWRQDTTGVPQGSILVLTLLSIFINTCTLEKRASSTSSQRIQNCEEWLMHQVVMLPSRGISTG